MFIVLYEFAENCFSAIRANPAAIKSRGQLQHRQVSLFNRETGTGNQILMNTNGAVDLSALPEQITQRQVGFQRFVVNL